VIIVLLLAILGKESSRGRHHERSSAESDALSFSVSLSEVPVLPSDLFLDRSVRNSDARQIRPEGILADEV
jgi:hypothetical protein